MKTKYRVFSNGYCYFLQYEVITKQKFLFWEWEIKKYKTVPEPYFDFLRGYQTLIENDLKHFLNTTETDEFVAKYPDVEDYLKEYRKKQLELENKVKIQRKIRDNKKNFIKYYD